MAFLLRSYQRGVSKFPYIAQGLQSSILMATGDAIAQLAVEKKSKLDYKRWVVGELSENFDCRAVLDHRTSCLLDFVAD